MLRDDRDVDLEALRTLRARCSFADKPIDYLRAQLDGSRWIVHAYADGQLVGFARAISDGISNAYLSSVMVDPSYQRRGIGRAMLAHLMKDRAGIRFVLHTRRDAAAFYTAVGFVEAADMMLRERT
jgi:ribosomal protein S18 acetylase RimI-like enzyme